MQKKHAWIFFVLSMLPYLGTLRNDYALDDHLFILQNTYVQQGWSSIPTLFVTNFSHGISGFNDGLYRPMAPVSWAIEQALFGSHAWVGHLVNVLLYGLSCFLLFRLLITWFSRFGTGFVVMAALLFAWHPVHTEAVANIKGRDEILAFLFLVLSAQSLLRYGNDGKKLALPGGALFFAFSFLSKESAITAALTLVMLMVAAGAGNKARWLKTGVVLVLVSSALFLWRTYVVHSMERTVDAGIVSLLNNSLVEAGSGLERVLSAAWLQVRYAVKMIFPFRLSHDYSYNAVEVQRATSGRAWLALIAMAGLLWWAVRDFLKKGLAGFSVLFYLASLSVVANLFLLIGATMAERFLFTPSLGFCFVLAWAMERIPNDRGQGREDAGLWLKARPVWVLAGALILTAYGVQTWMRCAEWKNNLTLFSADVERQPGSARIQYNYGTELYRQATAGNEVMQNGRKAIRHLSQAIVIYPGYLDAWCNLGLTYALVGRSDSAVACFQQALKRDADYAKAYYNLGLVNFNTGNYRNAAAAFLRYINGIEDAQALHYIGLSYGYLGEVEQGLPYLERSLRQQPDNGALLKDLGVAYGFLQRYETSLEYSLRALAFSPGDKEIASNIALTYQAMGDEVNHRKYMEMAHGGK